MGRKDVEYLSHEDQNIVESRIEQIGSVVEHNEQLHKIDLVIEGGVGTGIVGAHIARWLFPRAIYIGTDLVEGIPWSNQRLRRDIDDHTLSIIHAANRYPVGNMQQAVIYASCFDNELIQDVMQKTASQRPLLMSINALYALLSRNANPWVTKDDNDNVTLTDVVRLPSIYVSQLHIGPSWKRTPRTFASATDVYYELEDAAIEAGWQTQRCKIGLLMLQSQ